MFLLGQTFTKWLIGSKAYPNRGYRSVKGYYVIKYMSR